MSILMIYDNSIPNFIEILSIKHPNNVFMLIISEKNPIHNGSYITETASETNDLKQDSINYLICARGVRCTHT